MPATGATGADATSGTTSLATAGTVLSPLSTAAGAAPSATGLAGAALSRDQAMNNMVATASQAKIRKVRVWFMECRTEKGGVDAKSAGHCAGRIPGGQRAGALQQCDESGAKFRIRQVRGGSTRDHDVCAVRQFAAQLAELFAQVALDPVAADRVRIDLARYRQAQARRLRIAQPVQAQYGAGGAATAFEHAAEIRARPDPGSTGKVVRGCRDGSKDHHWPAMRPAMIRRRGA